MTTIIYVQISNDSPPRITAVFWSPQNPDYWPDLVEMQDDDPRYLAYLNPQPTTEELAASVRLTRGNLLRDICDAGVLTIQRELRMTSDSERITYLNEKLVEVDEYAVALQAIPDQAGFPSVITWPTPPSDI